MKRFHSNNISIWIIISGLNFRWINIIKNDKKSLKKEIYNQINDKKGDEKLKFYFLHNLYKNVNTL